MQVVWFLRDVIYLIIDAEVEHIGVHLLTKLMHMDSQMMPCL